MFLSLAKINSKKVKQILSFLSVILISLLSAYAQPCLEPLPGIEERLETDIGYLASDELAGREPGTAGAHMAMEYILNIFVEARLESVYGKRYLQEFDIPLAVKADDENILLVNGNQLKMPEAFFPVKYSANQGAKGATVFVGYGIEAPELDRNDYAGKEVEGKIVLMDISSPDGVHPHSQYLKYHDLGERLKLAKGKGAAGVALVNLEGTANDLSPEFKKIKSTGMPVVFIQDREVAQSLAQEDGQALYINVQLKEQTTEGYNIIGYLDNEAPYTIVIGAHYDHLGMGNSSSLYQGEPEVHNGADDNASGTAGLMELVRAITTRRQEFAFANFLFIAFSGEEKGLLGSAFFVDQINQDHPPINYMLNMDMIGRMEDDELAVSGVGTSPLWPEITESANCYDLKIKTSESGTGPSDHTSFYYKDIPVLHFFTGTHYDYHKPTDDADKINFEGEARVLSYMQNIIALSAETGKLEFTPTKSEESETPRFSVTLGVMPDYMYEGEGMKIDGVNKGKPAAEAGMQAGDVVTKMGEVKVVDMMSYMKALGQFKKGDETTVEYLRKGKKKTAKVKF